MQGVRKERGVISAAAFCGAMAGRWTIDDAMVERWMSAGATAGERTIEGDDAMVERWMSAGATAGERTIEGDDRAGMAGGRTSDGALAGGRTCDGGIA